MWVHLEVSRCCANNFRSDWDCDTNLVPQCLFYLKSHLFLDDRTCPGQKLTWPDMGTTQFFIRFDSVSEVLIRLNSWLIMALQELIQISSWLKIWFKSTRDSKRFQDILIQINLQLKKLSRILIQFDTDSENYLEHWFKSCHDSMIRINCWFRWPFLGLHSISLTFLGAFTKFCWAFLGFH